MSHERRFNPKSVEKLERPERGEQFPVDAILDAAGVCGMLNVADIGAGSGYFALPIGHRAAPGKVYAVDLSSELLALICSKLAGAGAPTNVELVEGEASATGLEDASCDLIFLSAVWHEIDSHKLALREFSRIAAPNAKLAIVDWIPEAAAPPGPPAAHRIARATVEQTLEQAGWCVVKSDVVSEWTYIVVGQQ
jgi:ubiquinone/menaquinone biosynthesis C-methylase UbiE